MGVVGGSMEVYALARTKLLKLDRSPWARADRVGIRGVSVESHVMYFQRLESRNQRRDRIPSW